MDLDLVEMLKKTKAFVALTKPRVIELLLITTLPTMILARGEIGATITSAAISETFRFPLQVSYQDGRFSAIAS